MPRFYEEFTITWIIQDYGFYNVSPAITAENIDKTQWKIHFQLDLTQIEKYISISLVECDGGNVTVDIEMELYDSKKEVLYITEKINEAKFSESLRRHDFTKMCLTDKLKVKMAEVSTLIVRCRMGTSLESETLENPLNRSCTVRTITYWEESFYLREAYFLEDPHHYSIFLLPIRDKNLNVHIKAPHDDLVFEFRPCVNTKPPIGIYKCEIILLDQEGKEIISKSELLLFNETDIFNFPSFCKKSFLLEKNICVLYLKFKLSLHSYIEFHKLIYEAMHQKLPSSPKVFTSMPASNSLKEDFRKMLHSKKYVDVSFRVDSQLISAHKHILASRSPVLSAMFDQEMLENQTGVINISDMDVQTLKLFLEFVYTGELEDLDWEKALDLLMAADQYEVPSLKEKCFRFLKLHISHDNVCDVVSVADMMGEKTFKDAAIEYIKENVETVLSSPKWFEFLDKNVKLFSEILYNLSEDLKAKHKILRYV